MDLNKLKSMSKDQLLEYLAQQEAEKLAAARNKISIKISQRGAISVYGMGRFPITLYPSQWETLPYQDIVRFAKDNAELIQETQEAWDALPDDEKARRTAAKKPAVSARAALVSSIAHEDLE